MDLAKYKEHLTGIDKKKKHISRMQNRMVDLKSAIEDEVIKLKELEGKLNITPEQKAEMKQHWEALNALFGGEKKKEVKKRFSQEEKQGILEQALASVPKHDKILVRGKDIVNYAKAKGMNITNAISAFGMKNKTIANKLLDKPVAGASNTEKLIGLSQKESKLKDSSKYKELYNKYFG